MAVSPVAVVCGNRDTVGAFSAGSARSFIRFGSQLGCAGLADGSTARLWAGRRAANAGRTVAGLCPEGAGARDQRGDDPTADPPWLRGRRRPRQRLLRVARPDRKSTRLNSSHLVISYAVFCLKKKKIK